MQNLAVKEYLLDSLTKIDELKLLLSENLDFDKIIIHQTDDNVFRDIGYRFKRETLRNILINSENKLDKVVRSISKAYKEGKITIEGKYE